MAAGEPIRIAFCNAHTAYMAFKDRGYRRTLESMLVLNDGLGLDMAAKLLVGQAFPENMNGTDFVPRLLDYLPGPLRIFLLGGTEPVVERTARLWSERFRRHVVVGYHHGYFDANRERELLRLINESGADILLVAMGNPRQEHFIVANSHELECRLAIGVGALFDFTAEKVHRAPFWIQRYRLEWLFRLLQEPKRLGHRYTIELVAFLAAVIRFKLQGVRNH
jgi:exopolysaccharide biosynthesis WecB/TagA/CpsF family protein